MLNKSFPFKYIERIVNIIKFYIYKFEYGVSLNKRIYIILPTFITNKSWIYTTPPSPHRG
jgi:hypothetical protein